MSHYLATSFSRRTPRLWESLQIKRDFLIAPENQKGNSDEWRVYLLLAGRWMIRSGPFRRAQHPWVDPPTTPWLSDWVRCVHVRADPLGCIDVLTIQATYKRRSVITVTWESCSARSTLTAETTAYAETQIILFYYLPDPLLEFIVVTDLHNEPGPEFDI